MPFFGKTKNPLIARITRSKLYFFVFGWVIRVFMEALYITLRIEYRGCASLPKKCIIALWHNNLALGPLIPRYFKKNAFSLVVSKSRDGQLLSAFLTTYSNVEVIQVGHQKRHSALLHMIEELQKNRVLMITPDGPRGPAFILKPGTCFSSQQADAPIIPMQWYASKVFTFNTWDKLVLPLPFSKVVITLKEPIVSSERSAEELALALKPCA